MSLSCNATAGRNLVTDITTKGVVPLGPPLWICDYV